MAQATNTAFLARAKPGFLSRLVGAETPMQTRDALQGYLFLLPWLIGFVLFVGGPIIASLYFSLTDYEVLSRPSFLGLANYQKALFKDSLFWPSLGRTLYYSSVVVPLTIVGALFLAIILNQHLFATNVFRTFFFLPHLTPAAAMAVLWTWLLHPQLGPVNLVLGKMGLPQPGWMASREWVIPALILVSLWASMGGNNMLIFLAGLQGVPQELYEAADIDGGGTWTKFRHITLPIISPSILFNLVLGVIGALKVFGLAYIATGGGPAYGSWFFALHIYNQAFLYFRLGYGCSLAWMFAAVLGAFTFLQLKLSNRWVFYAGGNS